MTSRALIAGVGMVPFTKPGRSQSYDLMGRDAVLAALADAGISYADVGQAYASYVYGMSTSGQQSLYQVGLSGLPIVNVNNNCASGSTALFLARQAVEAGAVEVALAFGFEEMLPGVPTAESGGRKNIMEKQDLLRHELLGEHPEVMIAGQYFGGAGQEYTSRYGTAPEVFAMISVKARRHAANNPYAVFRDPVTVEEVMASKPIFGPITRLQCCPPTCGAAAALVVAPRYAARHGIRGVEMLAQAMTTDGPSTFESRSMIQLIGYDMTKSAARQVYESAGVGPEELQVVELHDCFTSNELLTYEALGLSAQGGAERMIRDGDNTYGGRYVINPSGGLLSKGHPLGATGLAQCVELVWQLRGSAGARQVPRARLGLQHNLGMGGACVVTLYRQAA